MRRRRLIGAVVVPLAMLACSSSRAGAFSYSLAPTRVVINGDALQINGRLEVGGERPRLTGKVSGARLDLRPWLTPRPEIVLPQPVPDDRDASSSAVLSREPLPFDLLRTFDAALDADLERLVLDGTDLVDVRAVAAVARGALSLDLLSASLGDGRLDGAMQVDAAGERPTVTLALRGRDLASADLLRLAGQPAVLEAPAELRADLRADGASLAALAGTLSGRVTTLLDQGRLETGPLRATSDGAERLLTTLQRGGPSSRLNCAAFDVVAERGVLTPELAVLDTEYATLAVEGNIDLGRERLALEILPRAKVSSFSFTTPLSVQGSLSQPRIDADRAGAARELASLLSALAAPPSVRRAFEGLGGNQECLNLEAEAAADRGALGAIKVPQRAQDLIERGVRGLLGR